MRALRKALGLTQEALGTRVEMTRTEVNHVENGRRGLSGHEVRLRFARGLGVPVALLDAYFAGDLATDALLKVATAPSLPTAANPKPGAAA